MRTIRRGEIYLINFPFAEDATQTKLRPVLVVQADELETGLPSVIVVPLTSQINRIGPPSRVLIRLKTPDAQGTGLKTDTVVMADHIREVSEYVFSKRIGRMPTMIQVDAALRAALGL